MGAYQLWNFSLCICCCDRLLSLSFCFFSDGIGDLCGLRRFSSGFRLHEARLVNICARDHHVLGHTLDAGFFELALEAGLTEALDAGFTEPALDAGFTDAALDAGLAALDAGLDAAFDAGLAAAAFDAGLAAALEAGLAAAALDAGFA